jgi:hypothetical protein
MQVTATRRGLRTRITRLWKGPADEAAADKCVSKSAAAHLLALQHQYQLFTTCVQAIPVALSGQSDAAAGRPSVHAGGL